MMEHQEQHEKEAEEAINAINKKTGRNMPQAIATGAVVLVLAGAVGNCIDRILSGYVVDMFNFLFMRFAVFNLADIFVVIGVLLGAVYYLWFYDKYDKPKKEPDHDAGADSRN